MAKKGAAAYRLLRILRPFLLSRSGAGPRNTHARQCRDWGWADNIYGLFVGEKRTGSTRVPGLICLTILVKRKVGLHRLSPAMRIPKEISWNELGGKVVTDVIAAESMETQAFRASDEVGHLISGQGTATMLVKSGNTLCGLSCSHVVARRGLAAPGEIVESPPALDTELPVHPIGNLLPNFSRLSASVPSKTDAALFSVPVDSQRDIPGIGIPSALSNLDGQTIGSSLAEVIRNGRGSSIQRGIINGHRGTIRIPDPILGEVLYEDAVLYSIANGRGDSGAAVFRRGTTTVLGMHVAGDSATRTGVFLPIRHVVSRFGITLP